MPLDSFDVGNDSSTSDGSLDEHFSSCVQQRTSVIKEKSRFSLFLSTFNEIDFLLLEK